MLSGVEVWEVDSPSGGKDKKPNINRTRNELVRRSLRESHEKVKTAQSNSPAKKRHTLQERRNQRLTQVMQGARKADSKGRSRDK